MATRETLLRIGSLQGTASNVLLLMLALGRPTGRNELALLTGRSKHTIRNALARLEFLGLAQNHSRYNGWALTAYATQGFLADSGSAKSADPAGRAQPELPTHAASGVREVQKTPLPSNAAPPRGSQCAPRIVPKHWGGAEFAPRHGSSQPRSAKPAPPQ